MYKKDNGNHGGYYEKKQGKINILAEKIMKNIA